MAVFVGIALIALGAVGVYYGVVGIIAGITAILIATGLKKG